MGAEPTMCILVCGSREWDDDDAIAKVLVHYFLLKHVRVMHGGARGADSIADSIASFYGFEVIEYPADWDRYGKRAGILRNLEMLDQAPDVVHAFQIGQSRGTQFTIDEARRRGIPVQVHRG